MVSQLALGERRARALALHAASRGINDIAAELGVSRWTVRRDLDEAPRSATGETSTLPELHAEIEAAIAHPGELADAELTRLLLRAYKQRLLESGAPSA